MKLYGLYCFYIQIAAIQGLRIRIERKEIDHDTLPTSVMEMYDDICSFFEPLKDDRPLDSLLRFTVDAIQNQRWNLYE